MKSTILKIGILSLSIFAFTQVNGQSNQRTPEQVFTKADTNSDSAIDMDEFTQMHSRKSDGKMDQEKIEQRFKRMDIDADGLISKAEFISMHEKRKAKKESDKD